MASSTVAEPLWLLHSTRRDKRNVYFAEVSDRLRPVVFENVEIGLRETAHELPARVQHAHRDLYVVNLGSKRRRRLLILCAGAIDADLKVGTTTLPT